MKPPRDNTHGILHFFGGIRRSTLLAYSAEAAAPAAKAGHSSSFKGSAMRIHPRAYGRGLLRRRINAGCNHTVPSTPSLAEHCQDYKARPLPRAFRIAPHYREVNFQMTSEDKDYARLRL